MRRFQPPIRLSRSFITILASMLLFAILSSCGDGEPATSPTECLDARFEEYTIIGSGNSICTYYELYEYKGEYWTVWNCCECDLVPMAVNCDNEMLCAFEDNCMNDFFENATSVLFFTTD